MRRRRSVAKLLSVAALVAGCASSGVRVARSDRHSPVAPGAQTPGTETPGTGTTGTEAPDPDGLPQIEPVAWSDCADYPAPWQCGEIVVPIDYNALDGLQISLALIRLPAGNPARRIGSLVVNPGGPGGSGIALAYTEGESYPERVLDRFDVVGFDPRGVGASSPITCPASFDPVKDSYDDCIDDNRDLLPFLGTPNVARDMEMIRRALGDDQLTYLGYSYGSALGAVYADMFPTRVRAMVLDGSVDPDAGLSNTSSGGSDFYADQDFDATIAEFESLCDASTLCPAGPDTHELIRRVRRKIHDLSHDSFPDSDPLTKRDLDDILVDAMYSASTWPVLALALKDADDGDASLLAALYSWLLYGYPADVTEQDQADFANLAIRCADFSNRGSGAFDCESFPDTADYLPVITAIDTSSPILVVGTKDDPATPARYSPLMAAALGDAVAIEWEGAGHTATLTSRCITDIVADYLIGVAVPADGTLCPFVTNATTPQENADFVFGHAPADTTASSINDVLVAKGETGEVAACIADHLVRRGDNRLIFDQLLGIETAELVGARGIIERACAAGG